MKATWDRSMCRAACCHCHDDGTKPSFCNWCGCAPAKAEAVETDDRRAALRRVTLEAAEAERLAGHGWTAAYLLDRLARQGP